MTDEYAEKFTLLVRQRKKYKQCHEKWDDRYNVMKLEGHAMPERTLIKSPEDIRLIRKAAASTTVCWMRSPSASAGMTTEGQHDRA